MKTAATLITALFLAAVVAGSLVHPGDASAYWHKKSGSAKGMVEAAATFSMPHSVRAGKAASFDMAVAEKMDGRLLKHSNGVVKIMRGGEVLEEKAFHTHSGETNYTYTFPEGGKYMISVTFFPHAELAPVKYEPVTEEKMVEVKEGGGSQPRY